MTDERWNIVSGKVPVVAAAIHNGHDVRNEVGSLLAIDEAQRLREEDPFTNLFTGFTDNRIVVNASRFEADMNRPRDKAVYILPEDAWGLNVWKARPSPEFVKRSLSVYDSFYKDVFEYLRGVQKEFGKIIVLDIHSYNHMRSGPGGLPSDPDKFPDINIGTGSLDRSRWGGLVDRFMDDLSSYNFMGAALSVKENLVFQGGYFSRWVHEKFPGKSCVIAVEFKKFFMDEWTGAADEDKIREIKSILGDCLKGILEETEKV
ncbi:N-formylglutamate amidohydrolase [Candidatus Auribacterota bacterium]